MLWVLRVLWVWCNRGRRLPMTMEMPCAVRKVQKTHARASKNLQWYNTIAHSRVAQASVAGRYTRRRRRCAVEWGVNVPATRSNAAIGQASQRACLNTRIIRYSIGENGVRVL